MEQLGQNKPMIFKSKSFIGLMVILIAFSSGVSWGVVVREGCSQSLVGIHKMRVTSSDKTSFDDQSSPPGLLHEPIIGFFGRDYYIPEEANRRELDLNEQIAKVKDLEAYGGPGQHDNLFKNLENYQASGFIFDREINIRLSQLKRNARYRSAYPASYIFSDIKKHFKSQGINFYNNGDPFGAAVPSKWQRFKSLFPNLSRRN